MASPNELFQPDVQEVGGDVLPAYIDTNAPQLSVSKGDTIPDHVDRVTDMPSVSEAKAETTPDLSLIQETVTAVPASRAEIQPTRRTVQPTRHLYEMPGVGKGRTNSNPPIDARRAQRGLTAAEIDRRSANSHQGFGAALDVLKGKKPPIV
jgi:hypothetical protein